MIITLITRRTDSSIGLRLAGVKTELVRSQEAALKALEKVCEDGETGILLITGEIEKFCPDKLAEIRKKGRPIVVSVPDSANGNTASNAITDYIQNAIGIKID